MAKKRRRRSTGRALTDPSTVKPTPASPGGPNRQARKEEARQRRETLRRKAARRRVYRRGVWLVAALLAVGGIAGFTIYQRGATARAIKAAGCGVVRTVPTYDPAEQDRTHILPESEVPEPPALSTYPSIPPVSGPHQPPGQQLASGVYETPPDVYGAIHSLEHGAVAIWFDPQAPATDINQIKDFYNQPDERDHVIVAPYDYPDQGEEGSLPDGKLMAMSAWHHVQYCDQLSLEAVKAFVDDYRAATPTPAGYKGDAPEPGAAV
jgi:hypothetical protein